MQPQRESDDQGFINSFHKNHPANLMSICKTCHDKFTKANIKHRRIKTGKGMKLGTI
jgi:hypothetical protein